MKKILITLVLSSLCAACGGSSSNAPTTATDETQTAPEATQDEAAPEQSTSVTSSTIREASGS